MSTSVRATITVETLVGAGHQERNARGRVMSAAPWVLALAAALDARLIETHISWVLLGPRFAWKIKRPVVLPFVDYGSLDARRHCCEEEVRLNARLAPGLYLGVDTVRGPAQAPQLNGDGPVLDYAVRMRRFPDGCGFAQLMAAEALTVGSVDALAQLLGRFHRDAPAAPPTGDWGSPDRRRETALAALAGLAALAEGPGLADLADTADLASLGAWLRAEAERQAPLWAERQAGGHVRECHGDLHLDNLVLLPEGVAAFDGIEFDPALRWIDVIDDIAFPLMDFDACGRADLGWRLLSAWLEATGEYDGARVLRFSVVYRALVRARVALMREPPDRSAAARYLRTAKRWAGPGKPSLTITHGLPGSGKSFASAALVGSGHAIRLRADVERKRLHGLGALDDSRAQGLDLYTPQASRRTYDHLFATATALLEAGFNVILDAAFLRRDERDAARALASRCGADFQLLHCEAPEAVLRERLLARRGDPSEADTAVLEFLQTRAEPLDAQEAAAAVSPSPADRP